MQLSGPGNSPPTREEGPPPRSGPTGGTAPLLRGTQPLLGPRTGTLTQATSRAGLALVPRRQVLPGTPQPAAAVPEDPEQALRQLVPLMCLLRDAAQNHAEEAAPADLREQLTRVIDLGKRIAELRAALPRRRAIQALPDTVFSSLLGDTLEAATQRARVDHGSVDIRTLTDRISKDTQVRAELLQRGHDVRPLTRRIAQHHHAILEKMAAEIEFNKLGILVREHTLALPLMRPPDQQRDHEYHWLRFMAILPAHTYQHALTALLVARWDAAQEFPELFEGIDLNFEEASLRNLASGAIQSYKAEQPATGSMDPDVREVMTGIMTAASDHAACMEELAAKVADRMEPRHGPPQEHPAIRQLLKAADASWEFARAALRLAYADTPRPEQPGHPAVAARPAGPGPRRGRKSKAGRKALHETPATVSTPDTAAPSTPARRSRVVCDRFGAKVLAAPQPAPRPAAAPAPASAPAGASRVAAVARARLRRLAALLERDPMPQDRRQIREVRHKGTPEQALHIMADRSEAWLRVAGKLEAALAELVQPVCLRHLEPDDLARAAHLREQARDRIHQLETEANALQAGLGPARLDLMKVYRLPREAHWTELLDRDEVLPVPTPQVLPTDPPNTLFEVQLLARPLSDASRAPPPVWLHLHTHAPQDAAGLHSLPFEAFAAAHLKSDLERRRGRHWQVDQAGQGKEEVMIHRGKVGPAFIAKVLNRTRAGLADNPGP